MASQLSATSPLSPSSRHRPGSAYSYGGFTLPSSPSSTTSPPPNGDAPGSELPLPFPSALARSDFLAPDFDAVSYLSRLHGSGPDSSISSTRHQTLEDLRAELRERSAAISAELLELVNGNYTSFLGLGDELKGGEERVEDVRVGLLGFRRAVLEIKGKAAERSGAVAGMCEELKAVRRGIETGRRMLELDERLAGLEERLLVGSLGNGKAPAAGEEWDDVDESEEDEADDGDDGAASFTTSSPAKLATLAREFRLVEQLADSLGRDMPFVKRTEGRMTRCRNTILLDTTTAVKEARNAGPRGQRRLLRFLAIYRTLSAESEAVRVLKER